MMLPASSFATFAGARLRAPACRALLACICSLPALAQSETEDDVVLMDAYIAAAEDDVYEVLPTRESSSVFGTSRDLSETPRSVTVIESALTDLYGIRTVNDFVAVTAGSFTGNYFGVPGALDVRGERADNFFRGFRRIENRGNFPTPIASTDYVEIVKGPAPPVYGGGKVGGILNFIPKTAKSKTAKFIDSPQGLATVTVGSYGKLSGSIEYGMPFEIGGKRSGAYVFVSGEDSDNYYHGIYNKGLLVQAAFDTELTDAKIERVVTRNPERAARLELDSAQITLTATDGSNWEVSLGKTAERGGRYVCLDDSENSPAYLTPFGGYLDAASKNWAENKLVNLERDQIASITLTFDDDEPITITRASIDADWTSTSLPEGQQLKVGAISTLLSAGTTLRFSDATVPDDPDAIDAAAHSRTLTFTTFGGESLAVTMGRRPEKTVAKAADSTDETAAAETTEDLTETIPAGPTFAKVEGPATLAPLASANAKIAFKISDYSFASLPGSSEGMFEPKPKPATAVPAESDTPKS